MKTRLSLSVYHVLRWETCYQYSRQQPEEKYNIKTSKILRIYHECDDGIENEILAHQIGISIVFTHLR